MDKLILIGIGAWLVYFGWDRIFYVCETAMPRGEWVRKTLPWLLVIVFGATILPAIAIRG